MTNGRSIQDSSIAATLRARVARLEEALIWYENNVAGCRLIHSGGDAHRNALARDGGARAAAALEEPTS